MTMRADDLALAGAAVAVGGAGVEVDGVSGFQGRGVPSAWRISSEPSSR